MQDPTDPEAGGRLLATIESMPELTWLALVDTAFDYRDGGFPLFANERISCYQDSPLDSLLPASPCLVPLEPGEAGERLQTLIEHCSARPMLSFLAVERDTGSAGLVKQWSGLHKVKGADGDTFLLRFADTRTLAHLPEVLTPEQWQAWHQNVVDWRYINRRGQVTILPLPKADEELPENIRLDEKQFERILELAEPDTLLKSIYFHGSVPRVPEDIPGSRLYELAERTLVKIHKAGIEDLGDRMLLFIRVLDTDGRLLDAPELDGFLEAKQWEEPFLYKALDKEDWFKAIPQREDD
jgi:hypothetical protein